MFFRDSNGILWPFMSVSADTTVWIKLWFFTKLKTENKHATDPFTSPCQLYFATLCPAWSQGDSEKLIAFCINHSKIKNKYSEKWRNKSAEKIDSWVNINSSLRQMWPNVKNWFGYIETNHETWGQQLSVLEKSTCSSIMMLLALQLLQCLQLEIRILGYFYNSLTLETDFLCNQRGYRIT